MKIEDIRKILEKGYGTDFPGAHYCVVNGETIECDYIGYKELEPEKVSLKGDEIYDLASITKVVSTTTLIFKFIEMGKLELDTKIKEILPKYFNEETTISELLTHTSGLPAMVKGGYSITEVEELMIKIYEQEFVYEPGTKIIYSDVGYILLGFIIEKISNKKIDQVAKELIFEPLKMNDTSYSPDIKRAAPTEIKNDKFYKGVLRGKVHDERSFMLNGLSGHAGLFSTSYDIALYIKSILNDEVILSNKTKEIIFETNIIKDDLNNNKLIRTYGFNKYEQHPNDLKTLIHHTGFTGGNIWIDKKGKRGFVMLTNAVHPKRENNNIFPYRKEILDLYFK